MLWVEDWMKCSQRLGFGDSVESDSLTLGGLCRRLGFNPWVRKFPWSRKWQPTPVFWPGKLHGQRSLVGYSPWGHKRVGHDWACTHTHTHTHTQGPTHPHLQLMGRQLISSSSTISAKAKSPSASHPPLLPCCRAYWKLRYVDLRWGEALLQLKWLKKLCQGCLILKIKQ